jgi:hypothetical protein
MLLLNSNIKNYAAATNYKGGAVQGALRYYLFAAAQRKKYSRCNRPPGQQGYYNLAFIMFCW